MVLYEATDTRQLNLSFSLEGIASKTSKLNTGITDNFATLALSRLIGGGVTSVHDLNAAEQCLRSLIFHESIIEQSPSVTVNNYSSPKLTLGTPPVHLSDYLGIGIIKPVTGRINNLIAFNNDSEANEESNRRDVKRSKEKLLNERFDSYPVFSAFSDSCPLEKVANSIDEYAANVFTQDKSLQSRFLLPIANCGLTTYMSYPFLLTQFEYIHANGFNQKVTHGTKEFFKTIDDSWVDYSNKLKSRVNLPLPLFLAIVLKRSNKREDIGDVILTLRDEYKHARKQLWQIFDDENTSLDDNSYIKRRNDFEESIKDIFNVGMQNTKQNEEITLNNFKRFGCILGSAATMYASLNNAPEVGAIAAASAIAIANSFLGSLTVGNTFDVSAAKLTAENVKNLNQQGLIHKFFNDEEQRALLASMRGSI